MNDRNAILEERFVGLIERQRMLVRTICWKYSDGDAGKCAVLVQECYLALWRRLPSLEGDDTLSPRRERSWVAWICRSALSHHFKRRRHWWQPFDRVPDGSVAVDDDNSQREQVEDLAATLPPREQRFIQLYLDGYHYDEIAVELGIEINSVYKMRRRIIEKMKKNAGL